MQPTEPQQQYGAPPQQYGQQQYGEQPAPAYGAPAPGYPQQEYKGVYAENSASELATPPMQNAQVHQPGQPQQQQRY
jgi:hypothetical protein